MTPSCELQVAPSVRTQTPTRRARSLSLSLAVPYSLPCSLERKTLTLEFKTDSADKLKRGTVAYDRRMHGQSGFQAFGIWLSGPGFQDLESSPSYGRLIFFPSLFFASTVTFLFPVTFLCIHRHFSLRPVVTDKQTHGPNPIFRIRLSGPVLPVD